MGTKPGFFNYYTINHNGILVDPGRAIRRCRTNLEMSQVELAKRAKLSPSYISRLELNKAGAASQQTYAKIARAMGLNLDQMFGA